MKTIKQFFLVLIQFVIINALLALISSLVIISTRDIELIRVTNIDEKEYSLTWLLWYMWIGLALIGFIIVNIINIKKSYKTNKMVFLYLIPVKIIIMVFLYICFLVGVEELCPWNPLIDTQHSENFNVYNLDKIKENMTEDEVKYFIGDPLEIRKYEDNKIVYIYTWDGISKLGDYAWLCLRINFEDNKVIEIENEWAYD